MTTPTRQTLAVRLLTRFAGGNEPLIGDVLEEFHRRRSSAWLWRQVVMMVVLRLWSTPWTRSASPFPGLGLTPGSTLQRLPRYITTSQVPDTGLGGLGVLVVFVVMTWVMAAAWPGVLLGFAGGVAMGGLLILQRRRRGLSGLDTPGGMSVLDGAPSVGRAPLAIYMNMSAVQVSGIGGLGLVGMAVVVSLFLPPLRWTMSAAIVGGIMLGTLLILRSRHVGLSDPNHAGPEGVLPR